MSKRLQVTLQDHEYREFERLAHAEDMSLSEWVRRALGVALRRESTGNVTKKLEAIRAAARCNFPTSDSDIDSMLTKSKGDSERNLCQSRRPMRDTLHQPQRIHIHNHLRPGDLLLRRVSEHRTQQPVELFPAGGFQHKVIPVVTL
jgi:hypothetical protein